mmetsp:Transcript_14986/g.26807  ORF Transcript_14986/g.26807 Transcript_14986/m.26807 type:complete len:213 (-) Transcript_14986:471-1109(-)|eukprot:CAMPEP_0196144304 /NCGR_PEP_ID=MMETSP0910-20130528/15816_1 /TAXON_ID=49265 /ORGANISM="Thalassiosira rotula, Strain GSO102" /LENGTH=212 /DNA_ID=CAMNT_0041405923 /DNA_START=23 /DNA_END=661 /DNA_ORIENTATION=+
MITIPQLGWMAQTAAAAICSTLLISDPPHQLDLDPPPSQQLQQQQSITRLDRCSAQSNCVSSNYREPPNRYVSPFRIVNEPQIAFQRAVRDVKNSQQNDGTLNGMSIVEIVPNDYYIHVTVPGTAPSSVDDIELIFSEDVVNVKCEATVTLPPPPFCVKKNCINGNMDQRSRVERMGSLLGLPANDREEMMGAKWTPIFMNSDRVPGFEDNF